MFSRMDTGAASYSIASPPDDELLALTVERVERTKCRLISSASLSPEAKWNPDDLNGHQCSRFPGYSCRPACQLRGSMGAGGVPRASIASPAHRHRSSR